MVRPTNVNGPWRVCFFGTYESGRHPRVAVLQEGLSSHVQAREVNSPVGIDTATRVDAVRSPLRMLRFIPALLMAWSHLVARSRHDSTPDMVVVGHLGHLDVVLARLLFRRSRICLDYLVSLADTARDRGLGGRFTRAILHGLDTMATGVADVVLVDTPQSIDTVPRRHRDKAVVVPVGARKEWFADRIEPIPDTPLKIVFYGLFTPLQGAPVIGTALRLLHERQVPFEATLIGSGQDLASTRAAAGNAPVVWKPWVEPTRLPGIVRHHHVCLGIFGTGPKAQRVVPNKAYQGAAAGCVVVTSDTAPQRRALPADCVFVPPGDASALADALETLAGDAAFGERRERVRRHAHEHFRPDKVAERLLGVLDESIHKPAS